MPPRPTYDVPTPARLLVRLDNGKEWEAKDEDLKKFGFVNGLETYCAFLDRFRGALVDNGALGAEDDVTSSQLNPLRHLAEVVLCYTPDLLDHPEMVDTYREIAEIEDALRMVDRTLAAPDLVADTIRLHLFTEHKNLAALDLSDADAREQHHHEHTRSGTVRNHDYTALDWSIRTGLKLIADDELHRDAYMLTPWLNTFNEHCTRVSAQVGAQAPVEARED